MNVTQPTTMNVPTNPNFKAKVISRVRLQNGATRVVEVNSKKGKIFSISFKDWFKGKVIGENAGIQDKKGLDNNQIAKMFDKIEVGVNDENFIINLFDYMV